MSNEIFQYMDIERLDFYDFFLFFSVKNDDPLEQFQSYHWINQWIRRKKTSTVSFFFFFYNIDWDEMNIAYQETASAQRHHGCKMRENERLLNEREKERGKTLFTQSCSSFLFLSLSRWRRLLRKRSAEETHGGEICNFIQLFLSCLGGWVSSDLDFIIAFACDLELFVWEMNICNGFLLYL